jgi:hypothetical protein
MKDEQMHGTSGWWKDMVIIFVRIGLGKGWGWALKRALPEVE